MIEREIADQTIMLSEAEDELRRQEQQLVREQLGEQAYQDAYRTGSSLPAAEAVAIALRTA
jgi:hypothetical protein